MQSQTKISSLILALDSFVYEALVPAFDPYSDFLLSAVASVKFYNLSLQLWSYKSSCRDWYHQWPIPLSKCKKEKRHVLIWIFPKKFYKRYGSSQNSTLCPDSMFWIMNRVQFIVESAFCFWTRHVTSQFPSYENNSLAWKKKRKKPSDFRFVERLRLTLPGGKRATLRKSPPPCSCFFLWCTRTDLWQR